MIRKNQENGAVSGKVVTLAVLLPVMFLVSLLNTQPVLGGETRPCSEDIASFCRDVRPGGGRIISCLKNRESELTPVCKDKLQEVLKKLKDAKRICAGDIEKFCGGVKEGGGRIARCLGKHGSELSPACAEKVEWAKTKMKQR